MKYALIGRLTCLALCLLSLPPAGTEAQVARGDSLRPYPLQEVVVSATRMGSTADRVPQRATVITREMMAEGNGSTLGDALKLTPGLVIREYGGGGGMQMLSFRGMSSEQTLILVDGVPANNLQTGVIDLRMLPVSDAASIEVVRGGMSSLHGSNAMGGTINLRTDAPEAGAYVRVGGSAGSFGASGIAASARVSACGVATLTLGLGRERGSGRFPVRSTIHGTLMEGLRENSDYRAEHLFVRADWGAQGREESGFVALSATRYDRGSPGPLTSIPRQGDGRQSDDATFLTGSYARTFARRTEFSVTGRIQRSDERYLDATGLFQGDNNYRTRVAGASPVLRYDAGGRWVASTGWDMDVAAADGNALAGTARRSHLAWFVASELRSDTLGAGGAVITLVPAIRWETFSSARPCWSPQLGAQAKLSFGAWGVKAHASAGRSFRVPTMNELYYAGAGGFGNPGLSPEVALNAEAGLTLETDAVGRAECDLTGYSITTRDRIVWQPATSPFVWSPANIARSHSRGFEFDARWEDPAAIAEVRGSYAYLDVRNLSGTPDANPAYGNQLPYVPLETASFSVQLRLPVSEGVCRRVLLRFADQFLGQRYLTDDNAAFLPGEHVLGANLGVLLELAGGTAHIKYEIDNLSNRDVQGMPGYPLPLRRHAVSFSFEKRYGKEL